jgi:hypothetical protein
MLFIDMAYAVARSNVTLPAETWYFPTVVLFRSQSEKRTTKKDKVPL